MVPNVCENYVDSLLLVVCAETMLDGDTPEYTNITASSSSPGTNPEDALLSSDNPESFWSPDPSATDDPILTIDILSDTPATVTQVQFTVEDALVAEIVIDTPDGPFKPVNIFSYL